MFLFDQEQAMYPIDFKEMFGIDYNDFTVKPFTSKEICKLIYGHQVSSHNGGDFFNEIMDGHPNVICTSTVMLDKLLERFDKYKETLKFNKFTDSLKNYFVDMLVATRSIDKVHLEKGARIVPAIYFQPHFSSFNYEQSINNGIAEVYCKEFEELFEFVASLGFKYIVGFAPLRKFTNSYAATIRYICKNDKDEIRFVENALFTRLTYKGYYYTRDNRLLKNTKIVRFEDGKLNSKATFTALAKHLDIPYTTSMTQCSLNGVINPVSMKGNTLGFDTASVFKTYDEFAGNEERILIEYALKDAYILYGYKNDYWHGEELRRDEIKDLINNTKLYKELISKSYKAAISYYNSTAKGHKKRDYRSEEALDNHCNLMIKEYKEKIIEQFEEFNEIEYYVNRKGNKLVMLALLEIDDSLLENPLFH